MSSNDRTLRRMRRAVRAVLAVVVASLGLLASQARADVFNAGDFSFTRGATPGAYVLTVDLPQSVATPESLGLPRGCVTTGREETGGGARVAIAVALRCDHSLTPEERIETPWRLDGATFQSALSADHARHPVELEAGRAVLAVARGMPVVRSMPAVVAYYAQLGILHILTGWDHLTFVLCLCMLTGGARLLLLITTFTIGHSISLALSFLHVINVPEPPVEAVIALSIMFMAQEGVLAPRRMAGGRFPLGRYAFVVGSFGLLHGLGFADALREIGVAPPERLAALVSFNVGVEIGQLIFVAIVTLSLLLFRSLGVAQAVRGLALYAAGAMGAFWMIDRIAAMFGLVAAL
ncbi:HupE/UreJ family protein [Gluconacetobacter johannae]|uniref:HupE/UreJ family protein n=1 Tax=Gluconacetobacter johannae TaxID=112140 RepID=A0A7W4P4M7_9PROT|nr:HupE/UreJ family protein [Gluconacetobacter johannae]MBB2175243.1 HupE/UreJ family protein [Gluconacetobacter johannae]